MMSSDNQILAEIAESGDVETFDDVFSTVGDGGRWQVMMVLLTSYTAFVSSIDTFSLVFKLDEPAHWCISPAFDVSSVRASHQDSSDFSRTPSVCGLGNNCFCETSIQNISITRKSSANSIKADRTAQKCGEWKYDTTVYTSTVVSEWNLVCDRASLRSVAASVHMVAGLAASLLFGALGDRLGRARAGAVCIALFLLGSVLKATAQSFLVYLLISALTAGSHMGMYCCWYTFCVETVGDRWRSYAGIFWLLPWACGISCVAIAAWMLRSWRSLQLFVSACAVPLLLCIWLMPESPRWLVERGKARRAAHILKQIAEFNRRELSDDVDVLADRLHRIYASSNRAFDHLSFSHSSANVCREMSLLFGTRLMFIRSLATMWMWSSLAVVYYGISFDSAQLTNNSYLAMGLAGLMELPGMVCVWLIDRWGRRPIMALIFLLTAATILPVPFVTRGWPALVLGLFSKLVISGGFGVIYIYVEEYFPTCVRSAALGLASTSEAAGGALAPYISFQLSAVHWALPSVVFFVVALSAGLVVVIFLPETLGRPLPATVHDLKIETTRSRSDNQPRGFTVYILNTVGPIWNYLWRRKNANDHTTNCRDEQSDFEDEGSARAALSSQQHHDIPLNTFS